VPGVDSSEELALDNIPEIITGLSALLGMAVYVVTALLGPALMLCIYLIPPPAR